MQKIDNYYRGSHCKYKLTMHLVLVTKYRKQILYGNIITDLKTIINELANENNWYIQIMETDIDHIHILLDYNPKDSISNIVKILKQQSTYIIWKLHPELKLCYWKRKIFWSDGYFVCSIGDACNDTIRHYIENQG